MRVCLLLAVILLLRPVTTSTHRDIIDEHARVTIVTPIAKELIRSIACLHQLGFSHNDLVCVSSPLSMSCWLIRSYRASRTSTPTETRQRPVRRFSKQPQRFRGETRRHRSVHAVNSRRCSEHWGHNLGVSMSFRSGVHGTCQLGPTPGTDTDTGTCTGTKRTSRSERTQWRFLGW